MKRGHLVALTVVVLVALGAGAQAAVTPLVFHHPVADPSITQTPNHKYVAVATGPNVVRATSKDGHTWHTVRSALARRPSWARTTGGIWASDIEHIGNRWVLYFAAPVKGPRDATYHCIGVAVAKTSTGMFQPVGDAPLVCPPRTSAPPAQDSMRDAGLKRQQIASYGAIDPSIFQDGKHVYLLYKTDGKPSSIRILKLRRGGTRAWGIPSSALVTSGGTVENPTMLRHGRFFYLFTSVNSYGSCNYATVVRRSHSLTHWSGHAPRRMLTHHTTGLCGPGGADIVTSSNGRIDLYFHGWVCGGGRRACRGYPHTVNGQAPLRALYAVRIRFNRHAWPVRGAAVHH